MNIRQTFLGDLLTKTSILGEHLETKVNRMIIVYSIARKGAMSTVRLVDEWIPRFSELSSLVVPANSSTYYEHIDWLQTNSYLTEKESLQQEGGRGRPIAIYDLTTKGCIIALAIPRILWRAPQRVPLASVCF